MALRTSRAQLAGVHIVLGVTRGAIVGRSFEFFIEVATFARNGYMLAVQFEDGVAVGKGGWLPSIRDMAARAIGSKRVGVNIVFGVTCKTIYWCSLELVIQMATGAINGSMFPN